MASVTPNTRNITVTTANLTAQNFFDSPYVDMPLVVQGVQYIGGNVLTAGNNENWVTIPAGTASQSWLTSAPYPIVTGFTYKNDGNISGTDEYIVSNASCIVCRK